MLHALDIVHTFSIHLTSIFKKKYPLYVSFLIGCAVDKLQQQITDLSGP